MTDEFGGWHWDVFQAVIVFVADSCSSPAGKPLTPRRGRDELSRLCRTHRERAPSARENGVNSPLLRRLFSEAYNLARI